MGARQFRCREECDHLRNASKEVAAGLVTTSIPPHPNPLRRGEARGQDQFRPRFNPLSRCLV